MIKRYCAARKVLSTEAVQKACESAGDNDGAAIILGIALGSLSRLCRQHNVETPFMRSRRLFEEARTAG